MKNFGQIDIENRLSKALQKMADTNKDINDDVVVQCSFFDGGSTDTSNLLNISFMLERGVIDLDESILTLNGIKKILDAPDIKNSVTKGAMRGRSLMAAHDGHLRVSLFLDVSIFEETNLYKSLATMGKYGI
jgi:hypothetical protein